MTSGQKAGLVVTAHPGDFVWRAAGAIAEIRDQTLISSSVRKQPAHRPLRSSILQTLIQGEASIR